MKLLLSLLSILLGSGSIFCQSTIPIAFDDICTNNVSSITCFSTIDGDTRTETNKVEAGSYLNCLSPQILTNNPFTGNDVVYRFEADPFAGPPLTFTLTSERDLDLFIFECIDGVLKCIAFSGSPSGNETLTIEEWSDNYRVVIDAYEPSQNAPFELNVSCYIPCDIVYYEPNCDFIDFKYSGEAEVLEYTFSVPNDTEEGFWSARNLASNGSNQSLGSASSITPTFDTSGGYEICYTYPDTDGCNIQCCKNIWIEDPTSCTSISSTISNNNYILSLPNSSNEEVIQWINTANESIIGTAVHQITISQSQITDCNFYSVKYFDAVTGYYRICSLELCPIESTAPSTSPTCCTNEEATHNHLIEAYSKMCQDCEVWLSCADYEGTVAIQVSYPSGCLDPTADYMNIYFDCKGRVLATELIPLETWHSSTRNEVLETLVWSCGR